MTAPLLRTIAVPEELRAACEQARARGDTVAFVPTMGALHDGHLALVRHARSRATFVVASVFVNPTQFGPNEDFARYSRDLAGDSAKLARAGAAVVFAPDARAMYPEGEATRVHVGRLTESLCGPFRHGHFEGVTTIVAKLFALVGRSIAVFGRKDYQQLKVLERMARDLFLPVELVGHPIVRDPDGLAMSSRNAYLTPDERTRALALSRGLRAAAVAFDAGERDVATLRGLVRAEVAAAADSIDYVDVVEPEDLATFEGGRAGARALVAIACRIGTTRLIDNRVLGDHEGW